MIHVSECRYQEDRCHILDAFRSDGIAKRTVTKIGYEYIVMEEPIEADIELWLSTRLNRDILPSLHLEYEQLGKVKQGKGFRLKKPLRSISK